MSDSSVCIEGWLEKRGEFIKNWRRRYYQLKNNGFLYGFKHKPDGNQPPENQFEVGCTDLKVEPFDSKRKDAYGFRIKMLSLKEHRIILRNFSTDSEKERDDWMAAIKEISRRENIRKSVMAEDLAPMLSLQDAPTGGSGNSSGSTSPNAIIKQQQQKKMTIGDALGGGKEHKEKMTLEDFALIKTLGKGTFGKVVLARHIVTDEIVAVKILKKSVVLEKDEISHIKTENRVLQKSNHPFLTCLKYSFQTPDRLCFVMEYVMGGELFYHLSRELQFPVARTQFYGAEILDALHYLHDNRIIYRDLKLENIMLARDGHIKITDFGLCKEEINHGDSTKTFCGTPEYLAPEVLEDDDYGRAVDWWGLGVVMYEMGCGRLPFEGQTEDQLFDNIVKQQLRFPRHCQQDLRSLLQGLLNKNPRERLGGSESDGADIKKHPFFSTIDFDQLRAKEIPVPFVPQYTSETAADNFEEEFTDEPAAVTPSDPRYLGDAANKKLPKFENFTFVPDSTLG